MAMHHKVLLTGFMPFAGRAKNGSETLARHLSRKKLSFKVHLRVLDVVWEEPARKILPAVEKLQPDMIVGMGEGPANFIALETIAVNQRNGTDNNGKAGEESPIDPDGPDRREARFHFHYDCESGLFRPLMISPGAGRFLCNEHLYVSAGTDVSKVLFIHLPPQGDRPNRDYCAALAPTIVKIVEMNLGL